MTIQVASVLKITSACPTQWEGKTEDGRYVYVRYRWGCLSVWIADSADSIDGETIVYLKHGDGFSGVLGYESLKLLTAGIISWPEIEGENDIGC